MSEYYTEFAAKQAKKRQDEQQRIEDGKERTMPLRGGPTGSVDLDIAAASMETPIDQNNIGHKLLLKMGWVAGKGLGRKSQGRIDPVRLPGSKGFMGVGRIEHETEKAAKTTESRKLLEVEMVHTDEQKQKWKNEAERKEALKADIKKMNEVFLCQICNKQYTKVREWDNHLSSYDHHHKKRLKDLKEMDMKRKFGTKKKRNKRKQDKEMERISKLANSKASGDKKEIIATVTISKRTGGGGGFKVVNGSANGEAPASTHPPPPAIPPPPSGPPPVPPPPTTTSMQTFEKQTPSAKPSNTIAGFTSSGFQAVSMSSSDISATVRDPKVSDPQLSSSTSSRGGFTNSGWVTSNPTQSKGSFKFTMSKR